MKTIVILLAAVLVVGCTHNGGAKASAGAQTQAAKDEAGLAAALKGRVAGTPQDCVNEADLGATKSYGRNVIVFTDRNDDVLWVNRPAGGCPAIEGGRALRLRTPATRFCRGDVVTVFDPSTGIGFGSCALGEFTPYRAP